MSTKCRFSTCDWSGSVDDIFAHCENHHQRCIREHKNNGYYDFVFDDLTREAFLLLGKAGIYWFCLDGQNELNGKAELLKRGIFHIGDSEPIEYTLKLGLIRDGHAEYSGPHISRCETPDADIYDLEFPYSYLEFINQEMPSRQMRLYIGSYDDSDDRYAPDCDEITWTPEEEAVNKLCIEHFTCIICFEFIRRDARFCERQHFVCLNCFDELVKRRALRCPVCRADYLPDCHDENVERLLRMVKFPQNASSLSEQPTTLTKCINK